MTGPADRREVEILGAVPQFFFEAVRRQEDPPDSIPGALMRSLASTVAEATGPVLDDLEPGAHVGEIAFTGGSGWEFRPEPSLSGGDEPDEEPAPRAPPTPTDAPQPDQAGIGRFSEEFGTVEEQQRPGDELVEEAIDGPGSVSPPPEVNGWELVDDAVGNYTVMAWKAGTRPLFLRVLEPTGRSDEWHVRLKDARIAGPASAVDPHTRTPAEDRAYANMGQATAAAIRWMASHDAATTDHPFMDARIIDPPEAWELGNWSLSNRKERLGFTTVPEAVGDLADVTITIEGFHGGDSYKLTRMRRDLDDLGTGERPYPERGESIPRDRMLDEVTRFMSSNTPAREDIDTALSGTFDDRERGLIKYHALKGNLQNILGVLGLRGPGISRTFRGEIDDVDDFVRWFEQGRDFADLEGVGPSRREQLEAAARLAAEARADMEDLDLPEIEEGDVVITEAGNRFAVTHVDGTVRMEEIDGTAVQTTNRRDLEINVLTSGWNIEKG